MTPVEPRIEMAVACQKEKKRRMKRRTGTWTWGSRGRRGA
jgi:hypothetical protein